MTMKMKVNHKGHEFVNLGLPSGTLWATCNVGATSPEQAGLYFAWGETTGFTANQVKNGEHSFSELSYKSSHTASINAHLNIRQDAARSYMGGKWRIPTYDEFKELIDNCDGVWTENYNGTGVTGHIFISKINGNSVFFPASGICIDLSVKHVGSYVGYWSYICASQEYAWFMNLMESGADMALCCRRHGLLVRGIFKIYNSCSLS